MKYTIILVTLCLSQLLFSQNEDSLMLLIDQTEISTLNSEKESQLYFKRVSDLDIGIQNRSMEVLTEYGIDSPEHDSIQEFRYSINQFLLDQMREYLSIHPYPVRSIGDSMKIEGTEIMTYIMKNELASRTIIQVFIHAPESPQNIDLKKLYFPIFYQAYQEENIYSGQLWNFLHGLYRQVKREDYINLELAEDEQIEIMINELELDKTVPY